MSYLLYDDEGRLVGSGSADEIRQAMERRSSSTGCTGVAARWCPIHGDCTCPYDGSGYEVVYPGCPLHSRGSTHADAEEGC